MRLSTYYIHRTQNLSFISEMPKLLQKAVILRLEVLQHQPQQCVVRQCAHFLQISVAIERPVAELPPH